MFAIYEKCGKIKSKSVLENTTKSGFSSSYLASGGCSTLWVLQPFLFREGL